jgi:hypothetical protein
MFIRAAAFTFAGALTMLAGAGALAPAAHPVHHPAGASQAQPVSYGPQYAVAHVYLEPGTMPAFVRSWEATFGGSHYDFVDNANVTPTPSKALWTFITSRVGHLSVFDYHTPKPHPFGEERTGWGVTDVDKALKAAKRSGAYELVAPFDDAVGRDAVIQFPGGLNTQLWLNFTLPTLPTLTTTPENRVYITEDTLRPFLSSYLQFTHGRIVQDENRADAAEVGEPNQAMHRISITSRFGRTVVFVTDGHLPHPYGDESIGYEVTDVNSTIAKAKATGADVLTEPHTANGRTSAVVRFPGGYVAEVHQNAS